MKRIFSAAAAIALTLLLSFSGMAENEPVISLVGGSGEIGGTASVKVQILNNPGTAAGKLIIKYDKTLLEYESYTPGTVLHGCNVSVTAKTAGEIVIVYSASEPLTGDGNLVNISLKILSGKYAQIPLTLCAAHVTGQQNGRYPDLAPVLTDGQITVSQQDQARLRGDVNGDGIVDETDKQMLIDYILKKNDQTLNVDINRDGYSDVTDLLRLIAQIE